MYLFELQFRPDICPGVGLLDHMVALFLVFWGTSILFSIVAAQTYIPTNSVGENHTAFICFIIWLLHTILRGEENSLLLREKKWHKPSFWDTRYTEGTWGLDGDTSRLFPVNLAHSRWKTHFLGTFPSVSLEKPSPFAAQINLSTSETLSTGRSRLGKIRRTLRDFWVTALITISREPFVCQLLH